jgi:hypothetical protein
MTTHTISGRASSVVATGSKALAWAGDPRLRPSTVLRGAPVTSAYLVALAATTLTLAGTRERLAHWMMADTSTNLHNMTSQPLRVLLLSAFWLDSAWLIWPMAALLLLVMAPAERWLGAPRTLLVFAIGHAGATVVTVSGIAAGVAAGWLPRALAHATDVGPSYGLAALGAVMLT